MAIGLVLMSAGMPLRAQSYDNLWKQVNRYAEQGQPKSALATVQKIEQKAKAEGRQGQALAATLHAALYRQQVVPDSFFSDIRRLEARRSRAVSVPERAVLASVLGQLYQQNRGRSQQTNARLVAHPDSLREWTVAQYDSASRANYLLSMEAPAGLARVRAAEWVPFVVKGKHANYFGGDLLNVIGLRALQAFSDGSIAENRSSARLVMERLLAQYRSAKNREAELLLLLDSVDMARQIEQPVYPIPLAETSPEEQYRNPVPGTPLYAYRSLLNRFSDLPLAAEVYLRMVDLSAPDSLRHAWALEGLRRYPRYARIGELENRRLQLEHPELSFTLPQVIYPDTTAQLVFTRRRMQAARVQVYHLKPSYSEEAYAQANFKATYLRKHGALVETFTHTFTPVPVYERRTDTLSWRAPSVGRYALIANPVLESGAPGEVTAALAQTQVSTLTSLWQRGRADKQRMALVVDALSGRPVAKAQVQLDRQGIRAADQETTTRYTDAEGRAYFPSWDSGTRAVRAYAHVRLGESDSLPKQSINGGVLALYKDEKAVERVQLYTDRAIYRPGQLVHVGAVAYTQTGWEAQVLPHKELELVVRDANGKEIYTQVLQSDEMGTFATDFTLPSVVLPGVWYLTLGTAWQSIRVEEYKRPTFRVDFDALTAPYAPGDTVTLTGRAVTFSGVPVREGRVLATARVLNAWRWNISTSQEMFSLDTVFTDEQGAFALRVPLSATFDGLRYGLRMQVEAEVLSASGETRTGEFTLPLCSEPLRLQMDVPSMNDRDRLRPWTARLLSPTDEALQGQVALRLYAQREGRYPTTPTATLQLKAGEPGVPDGLSRLASGRYRVEAEARVAGDSASWRGEMVLFGADARPVIDTAAWFYCPVDTFAPGRPAEIRVGSSRADVSLYYTLMSRTEIVDERLITFSDSILTFTIPYDESYGRGLVASFLFVKDGEVYRYEQPLLLALPDDRLRWQWTSFRDRLQPGAHETWRLRLLRPDGTPANARLMAALYDASLDALAPHSWALEVNRSHYLRTLYWQHTNRQRFYYSGGGEALGMPWRKVPALTFDAFDDTALGAIRFRMYGGKSVLAGARPMLMASKQTAVQENATMTLREVAFDSADTADESGAVMRVGGTGAENSQLAPAIPALRTNFAETAFFYPRLATDENGEVTLHFTLPESLTTWNFLGIAHTADLQTAALTAHATARKDFMARLVLPRFVREGDAVTLTAILDNLTARALKGKARLEVFDPQTQKVVYTRRERFALEAQTTATLTFDGFVPTATPSLLACRLTAESDDYADGEQCWLPVLSAGEWITESVDVSTSSGSATSTIPLQGLFANGSDSATHRVLTVEYTASPLWNAILALSALQEPQTDDVLSLASAYYAGTLAAHIVRFGPNLPAMLAQWQRTAATGTDVMKSPLARNEELTRLLLTESPWVQAAEDETVRRARLASLFDENLNMARRAALLDKLSRLQGADGSFGWFAGMGGNEYLTREVAELLVRLRAASTGEENATTGAKPMLDKALDYLRTRNAQIVADLRREEAKGAKPSFPRSDRLHYLYTVLRSGVRLTASEVRDNDFLMKRMNHVPATLSHEQRALAALVLRLAGREADARRFVTSLREHLVSTPAEGMYFAYPSGSFSSIDTKIATHTLAMEALREAEPLATDVHKAMRRWLLRQKRVQDWRSPLNSANAVYALLDGGCIVPDSPSADLLTFTFAERRGRKAGTVTLRTDREADGAVPGLGYLRRTWGDGALPGTPATLRVERTESTQSWGAVYAQYLLPMSQVEARHTGLNVRRETSTGLLRVGDKCTQRFVITADRDYEYVQLTVPGAACLEPTAALSGYEYANGLGFYRAVHDARTVYFFDRLPKGTYVIEQTAYVERPGTYSLGVAKLQCVYAPEFTAHTGELKLTVEGAQ